MGDVGDGIVLFVDRFWENERERRLRGRQKGGRSAVARAMVATAQHQLCSRLNAPDDTNQQQDSMWRRLVGLGCNWVDSTV